MPQHLTAWARLVHVHLLATGRGVSFDAGVDLPSEHAVDGIAAAMAMTASNVLAGLKELLARGFLKAKCVHFPGTVPMWMLFAR